MNAAELLAAYDELLRLEAEPRYRDLALDKLPELDIATAAWSELPGEASTAIAEFKPTAGWLRYQSEVVTVEGGGWRPKRSDAGALLCGELVDEGGRSLAIRPDGKGGLRLIVCESRAGGKHLVESVELLGEPPKRNEQGQPAHGAPGLLYDVFHQPDEEGVRPAGARFVGFAEARGG